MDKNMIGTLIFEWQNFLTRREEGIKAFFSGLPRCNTHGSVERYAVASGETVA